MRDSSSVSFLALTSISSALGNCSSTGSCASIIIGSWALCALINSSCRCSRVKIIVAGITTSWWSYGVPWTSHTIIRAWFASLWVTFNIFSLASCNGIKSAWYGVWVSGWTKSASTAIFIISCHACIAFIFSWRAKTTVIAYSASSSCNDSISIGHISIIMVITFCTLVRTNAWFAIGFLAYCASVGFVKIRTFFACSANSKIRPGHTPWGWYADTDIHAPICWGTSGWTGVSSNSITFSTISDPVCCSFSTACSNIVWSTTDACLTKSCSPIHHGISSGAFVASIGNRTITPLVCTGFTFLTIPEPA